MLQSELKATLPIVMRQVKNQPNFNAAKKKTVFFHVKLILNP